MQFLLHCVTYHLNRILHLLQFLQKAQWSSSYTINMLHIYSIILSFKNWCIKCGRLVPSPKPMVILQILMRNTYEFSSTCNHNFNILKTDLVYFDHGINYLLTDDVLRLTSKTKFCIVMHKLIYQVNKIEYLVKECI